MLDNIEIIRKNEVLAICDHCKTNLNNKCSRCQYLLEKFISSRIQQHERLRDEAWQHMMKDTLLTIIDEKNTCPHRVCFVQNSDMELRKLINLLKTASSTIQPRVDTYPSRKIDIPVPIDKEAKQVLLEVIDEVNLGKLSSPDTASIASTCMCRYYDERKKKRTTYPKVSAEMPIIKENDIMSSGNNDLNINKKLTVPDLSDIVGDIKNDLSQNFNLKGGKKNSPFNKMDTNKKQDIQYK